MIKQIQLVQNTPGNEKTIKINQSEITIPGTKEMIDSSQSAFMIIEVGKINKNPSGVAETNHFSSTKASQSVLLILGAKKMKKSNQSILGTKETIMSTNQLLLVIIVVEETNRNQSQAIPKVLAVV